MGVGRPGFMGLTVLASATQTACLGGGDGCDRGLYLTRKRDDSMLDYRRGVDGARDVKWRGWSGVAVERWVVRYRPLAESARPRTLGGRLRLPSWACGTRVVSDTDALARAQAAVGYHFTSTDLLRTALTHSSVACTRLESNERLEFLGDSILGLVVCEALYRRYGGWLEGDMTKVKSVVVSRRVCARISDSIGLSGLLVLGKGVNGRDPIPTSLRAAVFEAVVGAIYLDGGLDPARDFILAHVAERIEEFGRAVGQDNHKSGLQQYAQKRLSATPRYEALDEQGPDHSKCFEVCVVIGDERFPSAWGPSKKEAEQEAAKRAIAVLQARYEDGRDKSSKRAAS